MKDFVGFICYIGSFIAYVCFFGNVFVALFIVLLTWWFIAFLKKNAKKNEAKDVK